MNPKICPECGAIGVITTVGENNSCTECHVKAGRAEVTATCSSCFNFRLVKGDGSGSRSVLCVDCRGVAQVKVENSTEGVDVTLVAVESRPSAKEPCARLSGEHGVLRANGHSIEVTGWTMKEATPVHPASLPGSPGLAAEPTVVRFVRRELWWSIHNLFAHPFMQLLRFLSLFGLIQPLVDLGQWVHDATIPADF